jgi:hypothetical protein
MAQASRLKSSSAALIVWSAPSAASFSRLAGDEETQIVLAPIVLAICRQPVPTPPAAPRIRTSSPASTRARSN